MVITFLGYDIAGNNNFIALGSRQKADSAEAAASALNSAFSAVSSSSNALTAAAAAAPIKQTSSMNALPVSNSAGLEQMPPKNGTKLQNQNSSSTSNMNHAASASNNSLGELKCCMKYFVFVYLPVYLLKDPKTVKEEIVKLLEKEESSDKLVKLIKSVIVNLKTPAGSNPFNKQQQNQQQVTQQQPDLNYLMALSYVAIKKPHLFIKQPALVDVDLFDW